jgi:hypothetical protein
MTKPETGTKRKVVGLLAFAWRGAASRAKLAAAFNMLRRCIAFLLFWDRPSSTAVGRRRHRERRPPCRPQEILKSSKSASLL